MLIYIFIGSKPCTNYLGTKSAKSVGLVISLGVCYDILYTKEVVCYDTLYAIRDP